MHVEYESPCCKQKVTDMDLRTNYSIAANMVATPFFSDACRSWYSGMWLRSTYHTVPERLSLYLGGTGRGSNTPIISYRT